jgi:hypothetical protein
MQLCKTLYHSDSNMMTKNYFVPLAILTSMLPNAPEISPKYDVSVLPPQHMF